MASCPGLVLCTAPWSCPAMPHSPGSIRARRWPGSEFRVHVDLQSEVTRRVASIRRPDMPSMVSLATSFLAVSGCRRGTAIAATPLSQLPATRIDGNTLTLRLTSNEPLEAYKGTVNCRRTAVQGAHQTEVSASSRWWRPSRQHRLTPYTG